MPKFVRRILSWLPPWYMLVFAVLAAGGIVVSVMSNRPLFEGYGLGLTALGVIVAVMIYSKQVRDSAEMASYIVESVGAYFDEAVPKIKKWEEGTTPDSSESDPDADPYLSATAILTKHGIDSGDGYLKLRGSQVPLQPLSDALSHWTDSGARGRWRVGDFKGSVRRKGKGNHPWFLIFFDPDERRERIWRVSRGGQGKAKPTVAELP